VLPPPISVVFHTPTALTFVPSPFVAGRQPPLIMVLRYSPPSFSSSSSFSILVLTLGFHHPRPFSRQFREASAKLLQRVVTANKLVMVPIRVAPSDNSTLAKRIPPTAKVVTPQVCPCPQSHLTRRDHSAVFMPNSRFTPPFTVIPVTKTTSVKPSPS